MFGMASTDLESLEAVAGTLEPPPPHERPHILRGEAALLLDGLLTTAARSHGALEVAIGEGLNRLKQGDRLLRLGPATLKDYARERLGIGDSTARNMARLARELSYRPLVAEAVRKGELTARKAQVILPVAIGHVEAAWVEWARDMTVRGLEAAVRKARAGDGEVPWSHVELLLSKAQRETLDHALELARRLVGPSVPRWELLHCICEEYLSWHSAEPRDGGRDVLLRFKLTDMVNAVKEGLEHETGRWAALGPVDDVPSPDCADSEDPFEIDRRLCELVETRRRWSALVGHYGLLVQMLGLWRDMGFRSFGHYCTERLQLSVRAVQQRIALERRLHEFPGLREAMRQGRISYEKARFIVRHATQGSIEEWIARAAEKTCIALAREVERQPDAQMCSRNSIQVELPSPAADFIEKTCRTVEAVEGRRLDAGECVERIAGHFIDVWEPALERGRRRFQKVLDRDGGWCQVPGCSRPAQHVHHLKQKRDGGGDEPENLISLCAAHHLHGVHAGYIEVEGWAPDGLIWKLGVRPGAPPLMVFGRRSEPVPERREWRLHAA